VVLLPLATTIVVNIAIYLHPKSRIYQPAVKQAFHYEHEMSKFAARAALATAQFKRWDADDSGHLDFGEVKELFRPNFEPEHAELFAKQIFLSRTKKRQEGDGSAWGACGCSREHRRAQKQRRMDRAVDEQLSCPELIEILSDDLCNFDTFAAHMVKGVDHSIAAQEYDAYDTRVSGARGGRAGDGDAGRRSAEQEAAKEAVGHTALESELTAAASGAAPGETSSSVIARNSSSNSSRGGDGVAGVARFVRQDTLDRSQQQQQGSSNPINQVMATGVNRTTATACLKYTTGDAAGAAAAAEMVLAVIQQSDGLEGVEAQNKAFEALVETGGDVEAAVARLRRR
jgi:hypothetical protein